MSNFYFRSCCTIVEKYQRFWSRFFPLARCSIFLWFLCLHISPTKFLQRNQLLSLHLARQISKQMRWSIWMHFRYSIIKLMPSLQSVAIILTNKAKYLSTWKNVTKTFDYKSLQSNETFISAMKESRFLFQRSFAKLPLASIITAIIKFKFHTLCHFLFVHVE